MPSIRILISSCDIRVAISMRFQDSENLFLAAVLRNSVLVRYNSRKSFHKLLEVWGDFGIACQTSHISCYALYVLKCLGQRPHTVSECCHVLLCQDLQNETKFFRICLLRPSRRVNASNFDEIPQQHYCALYGKHIWRMVHRQCPSRRLCILWMPKNSTLLEV